MAGRASRLAARIRPPARCRGAVQRLRPSAPATHPPVSAPQVLQTAQAAAEAELEAAREAAAKAASAAEEAAADAAAAHEAALARVAAEAEKAAVRGGWVGAVLQAAWHARCAASPC